MKEWDRTVPMLYERNDAYVIEAFRQGEFDYLEGVGEVSEADFFRAIAGKNILRKLADTYPSACKKHDVPVWVYLASDLSMRFHGVHPFHAFPFVVRSGGMVQAFGPEMGHKAVHPQTGDVSLACEGFNDKNTYDRQTSCDQDYLRKMARRTEPDLLQDWFNRDVVGIFKQHHAFDAEGIFIGDATYLFVPNNPKHENSSLMLFDEHNHPVDASRLTAKERARCTWKHCYKLVSLIHTNWSAEFFLYAAVSRVETFSSCPVPLDVLVNREIYADGHIDYWALLDTAPFAIRPVPARHMACAPALKNDTANSSALVTSSPFPPVTSL